MQALFDALLPVALIIIMLGLGLALTVADFQRALLEPRAVAVALICQVIALPLVCVGIAHMLSLPPELAVGMMLLAASPGGIVANVFSHLARGDVALNITLTAVNTALSLFTMPLVVSWSLTHFMGADHDVPVQLGKLVQVLVVVVAPVALGMALRVRRPVWAARLDRPVRLLGGVVLALIIAATMLQVKDELVAHAAAVGGAALLFNIASLVVGTGAARLARLNARQSTAIGMEVGVHNAGLAIVLARTVLSRPALAAPAAIYGVIMLLTAGAYGAWMSARARRA